MIDDRRRGKTPHNALSSFERQRVLSILNSDDFVDETPYEIVPKLMDQGRWLCSIRSMYRILKENEQVKERRKQRKHPVYVKPTFTAKNPNEIWSWDITRVKGPYAGKNYFLYVMIDLFSRYVVGWMVSHQESGKMAQHFIRETLRVNHVDPNKLTIHSDRGSPMTASNTVSLLAALGLSQSFSRPRISNDNPFSEAQFKTLKYHRLFKDRYENVDDAKQCLDKFFAWYNNDHMHSSLGLMTPSTVHEGRVKAVATKRLATMEKAFKQFPERFSRGIKVQLPATEVGLNIPKSSLPAIKHLRPKSGLN